MNQQTAVVRFGTLNPSLENLRADVGPRINTDTIALELTELLSNIHAGFLFEDEGEDTLRILCSWVGATAVGKPYTNWMEFASCLNLTRIQVKNIENFFQQIHGPVWWVLASYAQWDDATVGKVIHALQQTEREDVLNMISNGVRELAHRIHSHPSLPDGEPGIFRPPTIPWVPLVLRPPRSEIKKVYKIVNITSTIPSVLERRDNRITDNSRIITPMALTVMLTFASDGVEAANRITKILRSHDPRIGVLILNEQMSHVFAKGLEFVDDCIDQVDAVIPILTKEYFDKINSRPTGEKARSSFGRDEEYVKYIYESLREEFQHNGWKNQRVGCIVPDDQNFDLPKMNVVLRAWFSESRIETLINLLLPKVLQDQQY